MQKYTKSIAVIGAGIAGVTAAYELARKGFLVTVFEKHRYPAMATSHANGSQLSVCNSQTWTTWPMIKKGLHDTFHSAAPFKLSLNPFDLEKLKWLARFCANAFHGTSVKNTQDTIRMALASRIATLETAEREGIQFDHVSKGILHIYTNARTFRAAFDVEKLMTSSGCEWEIIDCNYCRRIEPALVGNTQLIGGVYTKSDSTGDMHLFVKQLAVICADRYGVEFKFGNMVEKINPSRFGVYVDETHFDACVIAAGCETQHWSRQFGDRLGIYPVKGYSITIDLTDADSQKAAPWASLLDEDAKIVASRLGDQRLRIAGTAEINGHNLDIHKHRVDPLINWTNIWFPSIDTSSFKPWTGLRPMTPSMMPVVRASRAENVWYHSGHGHLGWTLSSGTARRLAAMIE